MVRLFSILAALLLLCLPPLVDAVQWWQTGEVTDAQPADVHMIRRPGLANYSGTRTISWANMKAALQSGFAPVAFTGIYADLSGLPATFPPSSHTQGIDTVTGLQSALDGKEAAGTAAAAITGHEAAQNHPATTTALPEGTNLYHTTARAAAAAPVQSVAGRTGAVTLSTADVAGYTPPVNPDWNAGSGLAQILNRPAETCAGRLSWDGLDGTQIYFGSGAPASGTGIAKDFYIDSASYDLYRKEGEPAAWTLKGNLNGPANTIAIGTVTTLPYNQSATATITGTAPNQTLSLGLVQGVPGDPGTLTRNNITDKLLQASDTVVYLQPATDSPTAGGLVVNDYGTNAAVIIQNGRVEVKDTSGITLAKIDRAAGTIATYDTSGNLSTKMDRTGGIYAYKAANAVGISWTRASGALVIY